MRANSRWRRKERGRSPRIRARLQIRKNPSTVVVRTCCPTVGRPSGQRRSAQRAMGTPPSARRAPTRPPGGGAAADRGGQNAVELVEIRLEVVGDDQDRSLGRPLLAADAVEA